MDPASEPTASDTMFLRAKEKYRTDFAGTIEDITQRERAERRLRESEERLRLALESARMGTWVLDVEASRVSLDAHHERLFGLAEGTFEGSKDGFLRLVHPADRAAIEEATVRTLADGVPFQVRYRVVRPDGALRWMASTGRMRCDDQGRPLCIHGVVQDVTEQQQAEETRVQLEAQLRAAQKLEAIGTLAGGIAHDFNNILAAIMGYVELAKSDVPEHAVLQADLDEVFKATVRAKELVQQILTFSRQPERGGQLVRLQSVVKESMKLLRPGLPSTVEIADRVDSTTPLVQGDPVQLEQVVVQLVTNAAHSVAGRGGTVEVKVAPAWVDENMAAAHPGLRAGRHATLCVQDEGHGMSPEVLERIFDPFFTTKTPGEGTGLGLSVVHGIVRAHQGAILVQSIPGQGSTFAVYLPAVETGRESGPEPSLALVRGAGQRLLLVDDEPALIAAGRRCLEGVGYRVTVFTNALEAWDGFQQHPEGFDLVITDHTMPGLTGPELAKRMLGLRPGLPILLTTGYSPELTDAVVGQSGIRGILMKPYTPERLFEMIQQCLGSHDG